MGALRKIETTRRRIAIVAVVAILMLLCTAATAQPGGYAVEGGTIAGDGYRLTSIALPGSDVMSGGRYQLFSLAEATATGSGCCCTNLPCILRNR